MTQKSDQKRNRQQAKEYDQRGTEAYKNWDIDLAVKYHTQAVELEPDDSEYILNLARALVRSGDFDQALRALANFIRVEPDAPSTERFQQLFATGMDEIEQILIEKMTQAGIPINEIGTAIQMWMEYRITIGRETLNTRKPETWAAALDYTVRKVNLRPVTRKEIAALYGVSNRSINNRHEDLMDVLDIMPCDYRYFTGEENPLDKMVEAAELMDKLEKDFHGI